MGQHPDDKILKIGGDVLDVVLNDLFTVACRAGFHTDYLAYQSYGCQIRAI